MVYRTTTTATLPTSQPLPQIAPAVYVCLGGSSSTRVAEPRMTTQRVRLRHSMYGIDTPHGGWFSVSLRKPHPDASVFCQSHSNLRAWDKLRPLRPLSPFQQGDAPESGRSSLGRALRNRGWRVRRGEAMRRGSSRLLSKASDATVEP